MDTITILQWIIQGAFTISLGAIVADCIFKLRKQMKGEEDVVDVEYVEIKPRHISFYAMINTLRSKL